MDALAAYGSDDDSSSQESNGRSAPSAALTGLIAYSDDEDSGDEQKNETRVTRTTKKDTTSAAARKRKRSWDNAGTDDTLPPPPLSDTSMIHWTTDYTADYRTAQDTSQVSPDLVEKLEGMRSDGSNVVVSWAKHLKSQHEFHNPHFFQNVVSHFGIQNDLGSHIKGESFQLFEFELAAAEEQARIRDQERQQQETMASNYAKQHLLEEAMKIRR